MKLSTSVLWIGTNTIGYTDWTNEYTANKHVAIIMDKSIYKDTQFIIYEIHGYFNKSTPYY